MFRYIFIIFALNLTLFGKILDYNEFKDEPKSLTKDYYIYRILTENPTNIAEKSKLHLEIFRNIGKIKSEILKFVKQPTYQLKCEKFDYQKRPKGECLKRLLSVKNIKALDRANFEKMAQFFKDDKEISLYLQGFKEKNQAQFYIDNLDVNSFFLIYNFYKDEINFNLNSDFTRLANENHQFKQLISQSVIGNKNPNFKKALLKADPLSLTQENAFLSGINAILLNEENLAKEFFKNAQKSYKFQSQKDKALFFIYLIEKDLAILEQLSKSSDINIYSIYAKELTGGGEFDIVIPNPTTKTLENYDITDPFLWEKTKRDLKDLNSTKLEEYALKFYTKNTIGEYSYIMERATKGKKHYYPLPFFEHIGSQNVQRQALILALARQESRFVPSVISTSYALGIMQFMPFLANNIGKKELKIENFDQDDMFKPEVAYKFANFHLDYLEKYLFNPVLIAYAYNGGIGFTKRVLQRGDLFSPNSKFMKFEPFLSMELIPYAESRIYAKKVLANYIVYLSILNANTRISQFFENLMMPELSDRFRQVK